MTKMLWRPHDQMHACKSMTCGSEAADEQVQTSFVIVTLTAEAQSFTEPGRLIQNHGNSPQKTTALMCHKLKHHITNN